MMLRPSKNDDYILKESAEKLAILLLNWEQPDIKVKIIDPSEHQEYINDMYKALNRTKSQGFDSYKICAVLESLGYDSDENLVEEMTKVWGEVNRLVSKTEKDWVILYDLKPIYKVGDIIDVEGNKGEIVSVDESLAKYTIFIEALGHVKSKGILGVVRNFEDVQEFKTE